MVEEWAEERGCGGIATLGDGTGDRASGVLLRVYFDGNADLAGRARSFGGQNLGGVRDRIFTDLLGIPSVSGPGCAVQQAHICIVFCGCFGGVPWVSTLLTANLAAFTAVLTAGCAAAVMFGNTHQGWMPDVIQDHHYSHVGATTNVANLGAAGLFATLTVVLVRTLPAAARGRIAGTDRDGTDFSVVLYPIAGQS